MHRYRLFVLLLICLLDFSSKDAATSQAPPEIVATLPRFCWAQYIPTAKDNPEYMIPDSECGAFSNHFCPGLVHMAFAEKAKELRKKEVEFNMARADMEYTLNFSEEFPECRLRPIAQRNLIRIRSELELIKIRQQNRRVYK
jgi:hypothetical protein